jgi:hypothetical protein
MIATILVSYSYHGEEISIFLGSAEFIPLEVQENQVVANYTINDPSFTNQKINSVMKVYLPNGTLIKTSSSADGLIVNQLCTASCNINSQ